MKSWISMLGIVAMAAMVGLTGCKKEEATKAPNGTSGAATPESPKRILIGFIGKSLGNDVFNAAGAGAEQAAKDLSAKYGIEVVIENRTPNEENAQKQSEAIEALSRGGAGGIALSCSEANTVTPAIDDAVDKGIKIMCFDSDAPASKRQFFYGTEDKACGATIMRELARVMGDKGTIAILAGNQSAPNLRNRVFGVREELAKHPNMKELGVFYHAETPEEAAKQVQATQNANPSIEGWAFIGGWPLFTDNALPWQPGTIKVVSCDALPKQLAYLKSGHVAALYGQDCYGWGYKSVTTLVESIAKDISPATPVILDPLTLVTTSNVEEQARNWEGWLKK